LKRIEQPQVIDPQTGQPIRPTSEYAYDNAGQLASVTDSLGQETSYSYDDLGRVTKITPHDPDGNPNTNDEPTKEYTYDAVGNLLSVTDALNHSMKFTYDHLFRRVIEEDALSAVGGAVQR